MELRYKIIHFDEFENSHKILIYPFIVYNKERASTNLFLEIYNKSMLYANCILLSTAIQSIFSICKVSYTYSK